MKAKYTKGDTVYYTWQGKKIKCEVVEIATEPGKEMSVGGNTYKVHDDSDSQKHSGEPLYKLKITDDSSQSDGQEVLHYEKSLSKS